MGDIYSFDKYALHETTITNVSGSIIGSNINSLRSAKISNVEIVICGGCEHSTITSVRHIVQNAEAHLSYATIISNMGNYTQSDHDTRTMILEIYYEEFVFSMYCSSDDICKIGCFDENACNYMRLWCYGECYVDCDNDKTCPTTEYGSYQLWDSTNSSRDDETAADDDNDIANENEKNIIVYNLIVNSISYSAIGVSVAILIGVCCHTGLKNYKQSSKENKNEDILDRELNMCDVPGSKNFKCSLMKEYFCSHDFFVLVVVLVVSIFLALICMMYGFGQITQLILSNYWCQSVDLETIYQHSIENGLNQGTNQGCWRSKQFTVCLSIKSQVNCTFFVCFSCMYCMIFYVQVDTNALFDSLSVHSTTSDFTTWNLLRCVIWLLFSVMLMWIAVGFMSIQLAELGIGCVVCGYNTSLNLTPIDSDGDSNNLVGDASAAKKENSEIKSSGKKWINCTCIPVCRKLRWKITGGCQKLAKINLAYRIWYKRHFGEDTPNWFILLFIREIIEIMLQTLAAYNYNGLNIFDQSKIVTAFSPFEIKLFCIILSINCILTGCLWLCYIFFKKTCHGLLFKYLIFFVDTICDTFYALFPIIVVTTNNGSWNTQLAIAVLQTTST